MKKLLWACLIVYVLTIFGGIVTAQMPIPFSHWPALYDAAENVVVKRGIHPDGSSNYKMYFRIGWGPCLVVFNREWRNLRDASRTDRYINFREYADSEYGSAEWGDDDSYNCPNPPKVVKPYWRGSRPTYFWAKDDDGNWIRGGKTPWRVIATKDNPIECFKWRVTNTNYHSLPMDAEVFDDNGTYVVEELGEVYGVLAVCEESDIKIEDYRFLN